MNDDVTKMDAALKRLKNVPSVAAMLVVGVAVIAIAQFTGALSSLAALARRTPPSPVSFRDLENLGARSSEMGLRLQAKISDLSGDEQQAQPEGGPPTPAQQELAALFEEYKKLKAEECYRTIGNLMAIEQELTNSRDRELAMRAARMQEVRGDLSEQCTGVVADAHTYMPMHSPRGAATLRERFQRRDVYRDLARGTLFDRWNTLKDRDKVKVIDDFLQYFDRR